MDLPTLICIKHNGDDKPEDSQVKVTAQESKVTRHTYFKIYSDRTTKQIYI